jgi:hypothetical protein
MKNLKQLSIEKVEVINEYLINNPKFNYIGQPIEMDDLDINKDGDIVYPYKSKIRTYTEEGHGIHTMTETYDVEFETLLTGIELTKILERANQ